ncbi:MAG TPA: hypothetical protein VH723_10610 [Candidatus Limnocylindrales bacterium]
MSRDRAKPTGLDVGLITLGSDVERLPIVTEISRFRRLARGQARLGEPPFEIVYVVPGRLGRGGFESDFDWKPPRGNNSPQVFLVVPHEVVESSDPMPGLIRLARDAVEFARGRSRRGTLADVERALDRAESVLIGPLSDRRQVTSGSPTPPGPREINREPDPEPKASVEVALTIGADPIAVDEAFAFETELEQQLVESGTGYVDGNEVGSGSYRIFTYGESLPALKETVLTALREGWHRPGATVELQYEGRDIKRVSP